MRQKSFLAIGLLVAAVSLVLLALSAGVVLKINPGDPAVKTQSAARTEWMELFTRTVEPTWTVSGMELDPTWTPLITLDTRPTATTTPCPKGAKCPTPTNFDLPELPTLKPTWTPVP